MKLSEATIKEIEATIKDQMENGDFGYECGGEYERYEYFEDEFQQGNCTIYVSYSVLVYQYREAFFDSEFGCIDESYAEGVGTNVDNIYAYDEEADEEFEVENWKDIRNF